MIQDSKLFISKIEQLAILYDDVKTLILLNENIDVDHKIQIASLNELRNAFDHLMRAVLNPEVIDKEIDYATDHLCRAGFDCYELIATNIGKSIIDIINEYRSSMISSVFPRYYQVIRHRLFESRSEIADIRKRRRSNSTKKKESFKEYDNKIKELQEYYKELLDIRPDLDRAQSKSLKSKWLDRIITLMIGIVLTTLGFILSNFI